MKLELSKNILHSFISLLFILATILTSCGEDENLLEAMEKPIDQESDYTALLSNQVEQLIVPLMADYEASSNRLQLAAQAFSSLPTKPNLDSLKEAYHSAYKAYQEAAIHNYYATANQNLIRSTNLFPIDTNLLAGFISNRSYNFTTTAQERASGFPAIDFLLFGQIDPLTAFNNDTARGDYLVALCQFIHNKANTLSQQWQGSLRVNFISNGGTGLGSSISVQLNESLIYFEDHVRENKVGIPIGKLGPNDSPISPDPSKIEAFYESKKRGDDRFSLELLESSVKQMESLYLGRDPFGVDGQGYDDLLLSKGHNAVDRDIKQQFQTIYSNIASRNSITGDDQLYNSIQALITLYKSDLLPLLNVQDADGANDGD